MEIRKAIEQRVQQRVRQEQMETKREAIAARAKGDLGTEEEERLKGEVESVFAWKMVSYPRLGSVIPSTSIQAAKHTNHTP